LEERFSRGRFIRLGAALGVGAAGASVLAACGGGGGQEEAGSSDAGEETTGAVKGAEKASGDTGIAQVQEGGAIARESEVSPGSAVEFTDEATGQQAVLVRLENEEFRAYSAICTHRGCTVAYRDDMLACPCHGSVFDPANGAAVMNGPAQSPLPEVPVEVRNGEVVRA
jgi:Rieske Fe-S protein